MSTDFIEESLGIQFQRIFCTGSCTFGHLVLRRTLVRFDRYEQILQVSGFLEIVYTLLLYLMKPLYTKKPDFVRGAKVSK